MRILITGAGGFVGNEVINLLLASGQHEIIAVDRALPKLENASPEITKIIEGDICQTSVLTQAFAEKPEAILHLAVVPGGAAEENPELAWQINVEATKLLAEFAINSGTSPRFVFASSVAVFGKTKPAVVDDETSVYPVMYYGAHKAMMEQWLAMLSRRGVLDAISLRLPGIVARPEAPSGMKSAFMSNVFHALKDNKKFVCPISKNSNMWFMSVQCIAANFCHALQMDGESLPASRIINLPALRLNMGMLVDALYDSLKIDQDLVTYDVDKDLESGFGGYPELETATADQLGFKHDGNINKLVKTVLENLSN